MSNRNQLLTLEVEKQAQGTSIEKKEAPERKKREEIVVIRGSITVSF
ncbi:MAG: hypothetical protein H7A36_03675 [Chlamydiales bacterium]|nr:hypothetical protein [Chlamydiales bacterium]